MSQDLLRVVPCHLFGVDLLQVGTQWFLGGKGDSGGLTDLMVQFRFAGKVVFRAKWLGNG